MNAYTFGVDAKTSEIKLLLTRNSLPVGGQEER